ncbi:hypothetical protein Rs2_20607 [Raphanus sativus]|nr:hypothetical protein Rs2_20607 [Raphanus sativus]
MSICSSEQMEEIRRNAVRRTPSQIYQPLMDLPVDDSETDSSEDMDVFKPNDDGEIRLEELHDGLSSPVVVPPQQPADANLNLAIVAANSTGGFVGDADKGKGIMIDEDIGVVSSSARIWVLVLVMQTLMELMSKKNTMMLMIGRNKVSTWFWVTFWLVVTGCGSC